MVDAQQAPTKKIINDIADRSAYSFTYPKITSQNYEALHEIHIFLLPVNPDSESVEKAISVTEKYNKEFKSEFQMKMCFLTLVFRNLGPVKVLQSARYFRSNDQNKVIDEAYLDANYFTSHGFDVVRVKIEANANSNKGIPMEDEDTKNYPKYFEFHIKVGHKTATTVEAISQEESEALLKISNEFTHLFKTPIPISWNNVANCDNPDNPGYQRFLNARFRDTGLNNCRVHINEIKKAIEEKSNFSVIKSIDEYVWYDTFTQLDQGWIDFTKDELEKIFSEKK